MKIVRTKRYAKDLKRLRVTDAEAGAVETALASDPTSGDVIPGLKGLRKVRFGFGGRGKRGGGRAIYFLMLSDDLAVMVLAYAKNEQSDLTVAQRKEILKAMEAFGDD